MKTVQVYNIITKEYGHQNDYITLHYITYLLTPWCRIFFVKLTVTQLIKQ